MESKDSNTPKIECLLCRAREARFSFSKHGYRLYRCSECDFLFVHPMPDDASLIYDASYFEGARHGFGYVNYEEDKIAMRSFFEKVLDAIEGIATGRRTILDVGAATGFFLKIAEGRGWHISGLEVSPFAVAEARSSDLPVIEGTIESVSWEGPMFDVITMLDVIEHVCDPRLQLVRAWNLLNPGGIIGINTPDAGSMWAKVFRSRWHAISPPEHLVYFNRKNLEKLLQETGFEVLAAKKIGKSFTPAYIASMLFRWQGISIWRYLGDRIKDTKLNQLSLPVNIRDNVFMLARKPFLYQDPLANQSSGK